MRRALSIWYPLLPIDLTHRKDARRSRSGGANASPPDPRPLLLIESGPRGQLVMACCRRALRAGVRTSMTLSQARAILPSPDVRTEPFTPARNDLALRAVAAWAGRFSPIVSIDGPDSLMLDITGCARVFKGEPALLRLILERSRALGFACRAAIASTFGCARALARHGPQRATLIAPGAERAALATLPIAALALDEDAQQGLAEVGVERIEQLMALPRSALPARFGDDLLLRLDQALGQAIETIEPQRPTEPARTELLFEGPTTRLEAIELAAKSLLDRLSTILLSRESGLLRLELHLIRADTTPISITIPLSRPTRDPRHLWSLLRPRLERANLGFGVERLIAAAPRAVRMLHEQHACWPGAAPAQPGAARTDRAGAELLDALVNRLGPDQVRAARLRESHIPERSFLTHSVIEPPAPPPRAIDSSSAAPPPGTRPPLLLDPPEPADVIALSPDGPVINVRWRSQDHRATNTLGPERIAHEWWRAGDPTRDYFKVQSSRGLWLWAFRQLETGHWFIHGLWA